jgi:hypothetical protein
VNRQPLPTEEAQCNAEYERREAHRARLEDEIAELFAQITAASYRLLVLIREFDQEGGWQQDFATCAHWLNWRLGLSMGAAREWVRVARALETLPLISDSMSSGLVSFSKVRALTRVATAENEAELLNFAVSSTAAHTETLAHRLRSSDLSEEELLEQANDAYERRELMAYQEADGTVVFKGRLDPESGAVFMRALEAAEDELFRTSAAASGSASGDGSNDDSNGDSNDGEPTARQRRADALALICESALASGLDSGNRADRYLVVLDVEEDGTGSLNAGSLDAGSEGEVRVSAETSRRFCCDSSKVSMPRGPDGSVLDVGRKTRTISPAMRRALRSRDGHCQFPGCACRFVEAHHVEHWAHGGETKLDNLVLLCKRHHRSVHEGGYSVAVAPAEALEGWWFFDASGQRIAPSPALPWQASTVVEEMRTRHRFEGVEILARDTLPAWDGSRIDWRWVF